MKAEVGNEMAVVEVISQRHPALRDVAVAELFSDYRCILVFRQGIVITVSGARLD